MLSLQRGLHWTVDRMVSIAYGVVYDYIFEKFGPYQELQAEVLELVDTAAKTASADRRSFQVLDVDCGPGNLTFALAEAGFTVLGLERYGPLVELAREKRRASRLANLAFSQDDLATTRTLRDATFDQVVSVHALYAHPDPHAVLAQAYRVLKPGGHAIFVNHTEPVHPGATFRQVQTRAGLRPALSCLGLWLLPHAMFEAARRPIGPYYWDEPTFAGHLHAAGFRIIESRRTFLHGASLLLWATKERGG